MKNWRRPSKPTSSWEVATAHTSQLCVRVSIPPGRWSALPPRRGYRASGLKAFRRSIPTVAVQTIPGRRCKPALLPGVAADRYPPAGSPMPPGRPFPARAARAGKVGQSPRVAPNGCLPLRGSPLSRWHGSKPAFRAGCAHPHPPPRLNRRKPSVIPVTIRPTASIWVATIMDGRGASPLPCRSPCSEPSFPRLISWTSGRHLSSIIFATGSSYPDKPGAEIRSLRKGRISVMGYFGIPQLKGLEEE